MNELKNDPLLLALLRALATPPDVSRFLFEGALEYFIFDFEGDSCIVTDELLAKAKEALHMIFGREIEIEQLQLKEWPGHLVMRIQDPAFRSALVDELLPKWEPA